VKRTYVPTRSFAALEEWEKSSAWMNLERHQRQTWYCDKDEEKKNEEKEIERSSSATSSHNSSSFSNSLTSRSPGASLLFRSSVGVFFTPPSKPTASLDVVTEREEAGEKEETSKQTATIRTSSSVSSAELGADNTDTPRRDISSVGADDNIVLKGWLSCRLVIPWLSAVSGKDFVRNDYEKEAEIGMHFVVLRSDGTLRRYVDDTMKVSSGPSIDVRLRVYDVSWTKETGASEQSFEIATKDGIYIFSTASSGDEQLTSLKWMRSIRNLCTATLLDVKNDKNVR